LHAAIVAFADAIEARRIGNRERTQHNSVYEGEYRGGAADAQGQSEHSRGGKYRREAELAQRVAKIAEKVQH
jgi:hypothetical protein